MTAKKVAIGDVSVPVVVLYVYHYGQIGVVRSLGRLGIDVHGVDPNPWSPGLFSKYCKEKFIWDVDASKPEVAVKYLISVAKRIGKTPLLVQTTDNSCNLLAEYGDELRDWYIFPNVSSELVKALDSKKGLYYLAKKYGVPTPETCFPKSVSDVEEYGKTAVFPVMLKEIFRVPRTDKKMFIARTKDELIKLYNQHENLSNPNLMLQEYIPGNDDCQWAFNGYFDNRSECLFSITGKKIRQSPIHMGVCSLGLCLNNETVDQITRRFMKTIGYKGIVDIGYRYDTRDGKYKILDVNPRIGATFRLLVGSNGLDCPRAQYLDLTGQKVPSSKIVEGRKWLVEDKDLVSSFRYGREKSLTISQWLKSFHNVQESAWFAWDDLRPFFVMCAQSSRKIIFDNIRSPSNPYSLFPQV